MTGTQGDAPRNNGRDLPGTARSCVPLVPHTGPEPGTRPAVPVPSPGRAGIRVASRKENGMVRDAILPVRRDDALHIVSEDYSYKTGPYYAILRHELEGRAVQPSSASVLDAYIVPVCLERARLAGIPVCEWGISQGYAPLPSIVYGLNYFSSPSDHAIISDNGGAKEIIKHITNKGRYPFCYQKLEDGASVETCTAVFGRTSAGEQYADIARRVHAVFALPLVTLNLVRYGSRTLLSSLAPTKYSGLSAGDRSLLSAYLAHQEFL